MKPEKLSVLDLFNISRRYVVPLYQRAYVWSEESQWAPLWRDVRTRAEAHLRAHDNTRRDELPSHFLGAIVLEPQQVGLRETAAFDVIDGQQRLTTLQLLLAALRDMVQEVDEDIHEELLKATRNSGKMASEDEVYKVWPTNFDREAFTRVLDAGSREAVAEIEAEARRTWQPVPRLVEAYLYFANEIGAWLKSIGECDGPALGADSAERANAMFFALRDNLQLVAISLEKGDDPQVIFETLNARGEPLLASDLVRNYVFTAANRENLDADRLYEDYWRPFDGNASSGDSYWRGQVRGGREKHSRMVLFFYHFLTYKLAEDLSFATIFAAFKRWWTNRDEARDVEGGLQELVEAADAYYRILEPSPDDRFGVFAHRLQALDITTLHPLLLFLQLEAGMEESELAATVADLESFLIRRKVCGLTSKNYNRFFLTLIEYLREEETVDRDAVRAYLSAGQGDSVRWPNDDELHSAFLTRPVYRRDRKVTSSVLQAIDVHLTTGLQEALYLRQDPTVEHVLPRAWRDTWPEPAEEIATPEEAADEVRDRLLDTFGNLTLLTGKLNSKVSNGPYQSKRPEIAKQSALRLNTWFQEQPSWDEAAIRTRGEALFEVARKVWSAPDASATKETPKAVTKAGEVVVEEVSNARSEIDPKAWIENLAEHLEETLPPELTVGKVRKRYVQLLHRDWPDMVHYEVLLADSKIRTELHVEYPKRSKEEREKICAALRPLKQRLEEAYPKHDVTFTEHTWMHMGLALPASTPTSEVVEYLQEIVMRTREQVTEYFTALSEAAD